METTNTKPYYAAGLSAFVIWGFIPFPLKALAAYPSGQILYFRVMFSVALLLLISFIFRRKQVQQTLTQLKKSEPAEKRLFITYTLLGGMLLTVNWLTFIYVINHINIQTGSFSYLLCPILTAVLGFLLLKEELRANQWLAIVLSALSCVLVGSGEVTSLLFSLLIALSYAFYLITQRLLKAYDKIVLLTLQLLLSITLIGPFYAYFKGDSTVALGTHFFLSITLLSAGFTVLPLFLNLFALKELTSGTIGILMYINPILNFVMAFLYFNEQTTPTKMLAYLLIFISVIIYNLNLKGRKKRGNGIVIPPVGTTAIVK
ncbi:chloramphenicol-sensitive protein RarD [Pontibacter ummariensis]|uniref:Chloramphenicol-sensitive protein RarD n=1 Tax=Pontibacter ummariensis TaxID=1610492 RepID=A0A239K9T2_9BACT|nr:EamA family transporter [Pontibacter ummariensis]PRY06043.1 chloramphenicol-sensitive protein RarD [Pontibacter ummariensis]SNT14379.1 chloramphenicol-sensitive protein RarD [Pontibacter ummariensis]